jgi:hypothetical protein
MYKISFLFIIFGLYDIAFPVGLINKMDESYTVADLIQGWGIYSVTIGLILLYNKHIKEILLTCFIISILWRLNIMKNTGYTNHHRESIIMNTIAIVILYISFE